MAERSLSRGREFQSTGRGGLGNMRSSSQSMERPVDGPDDFSRTRGRELDVQPDKVLSTGRGGAGNIRSPSRDATTRVERIGPTIADESLIRARAEADKAGVFSTGRGGLGNMSRSRSRDASGPLSPPGRSHNRDPAYDTLPEENEKRFSDDTQGHEVGRNFSSSRKRSSSKEKHGITGLLHKVTHPGQGKDDHQ